MTDKNQPTIVANISLIPSGKEVTFRYEAEDELSKRHLQSNGDIDCAAPADLGNGAVDIQFQLKTPKVTLDGIGYDLEFVGKQSVSITESKKDRAMLPYLFRCLLRFLRMQQDQFGGYGNPGGNPHHLRFTNLNNDGRRYKYTLRARARAEGGGAVLWLDDDPMIKNRGGGTGSF